MIEPGKRYHFVGIGGAGMSGLAAVMLAGGARVSGSDLRENDATRRLARAGAKIYVGHNAQHIADPGINGVIVSSAIEEDNVEVMAAHAREIPVVHRLHALARLLHGYRSIGVTGTHGKTTTTAMITTIMRAAGMDPTYLIGAYCPGLDGNSHLGRGEYFITEVDESDGLFLSLHPTIGVLNNIGRDHLNTYRTFSAIKESFARYIRQSDRAVLAIDDPNVYSLASSSSDVLTVGFHPEADLRAVGVVHHRFHTRFDVVFNGKKVATVQLPAPGDHNVRNSLSAIGAAYLAGVPIPVSASALSGFQLPQRRFQLLEENGVTVVDDYAHLPEEIEVTLNAIRTGWERRRIVAIFQPHRYTRTQTIGPEFGAAFRQADTVIITSIYPANERPIPGVSSRAIVEAVARETTADLYFIRSKEEVLAFLKRYIAPHDFIISFGAGDIWTVTEELSCFLKEGRFCPV